MKIEVTLDNTFLTPLSENRGELLSVLEYEIAVEIGYVDENLVSVHSYKVQGSNSTLTVFDCEYTLQEEQ
tara:strand:+ start:13075 stop:13284 length:210 start_codon:yes stop_codon:yes gene_type:complete